MYRTLIAIFAACALAFTLAACGSDEAPEPEETTTLPTADMAEEIVSTEARMEDGVQVVDITVGPSGYAPASISVQAGVPTRLVFTRTVEGDCPSQVQIPTFGVPATDLPMNEPTAITFTPDSTGTFQFVCGMEMLQGTIVVRS